MSADRSATRLVLLAHGSADPRWRRPFEALAARLEGELGAGRVALAYLQLAAPDLAEVVHRAAGEGVGTLRVVPLFLAAGAHLRHDVPRQLEEARRRFPTLQIDLLPAVGDDPRLWELFAGFAREALDA